MTTYRLAQEHDPNYTGEIASFIRETILDLYGYEVVADGSMTKRLIEIDPSEHVIRIRSGQPLRRFHALVDRAWLYVIGGSAWAPEFSVQPRLRLVREEQPERHLCTSCRRVIEDEET